MDHENLPRLREPDLAVLEDFASRLTPLGFKYRRLFEAIGRIPPAEREDMHYREAVSAEEDGLEQMGLQ